jgi:hypothetical protein
MKDSYIGTFLLGTRTVRLVPCFVIYNRLMTLTTDIVAQTRELYAV